MRHWAEGVARAHLEGRGWVCRAVNAHVRGGELDLVMMEGSMLVGVEVRQRRGDGMGGAAESLTPRKLRRLRRSLQRFALRAYGRVDVQMRIDAVLIRGTRTRHQLRHLRDVA